MSALDFIPRERLAARISELERVYEEYKSRGLKLDMSRGKPGPDQLDLTMGLLDQVNLRNGYSTRDGIDTRNYGLVDGIPEMKEIFAPLFEVDVSQVIVG